MKLYDELSAIFVGPLSTDEQQDLAKFASCMLTAKKKRNTKAALALIKSASDDIHDLEDYDRVFSLLAYLRSVPEMTKEAAWKSSADTVLKGLAVTSGVATLAMPAYKAYRNKADLDKSFKQVIQEHPTLGAAANLPMTKRYFDALVAFAPPIAKNSLVAGNVLSRMHRLGPAMMDINMVKELVSTNKAHQEAVSKMPGLTLADLKGAASEISGAFPKPVADSDRYSAENTTLAAKKQNIELRQWHSKAEAEAALNKKMAENARSFLKNKSTT